MVDVVDCVTEDLDVLIHSARPRTVKDPPLHIMDRVAGDHDILTAVIDDAGGGEWCAHHRPL